MTDTLIRVLGWQLKNNTGPALLLLAVLVLVGLKLGPRLLPLLPGRRKSAGFERRERKPRRWYERADVAEWLVLAVLLAVGAVKTIWR